ncbi:MAG: cytochrome b/b6 domain-containing protein [Nitrospiraceae bacterium]|nr:cytochrome b/b6 domain-containing protein [Nitrospiraceae bacterium]
MSKQNIAEQNNSISTFVRIIHLGFIFLGITAWLTGEIADDYKKIEHLGFTIHGWIGIALAVLVAMRLVAGFAGARGDRFSEWMPFGKERLNLIFQDIKNLFKMKLPVRETHQGIAGLVMIYGLAGLVYMAVTGAIMFFYLEPGNKIDNGPMHFVKEMHEFGEFLMPTFLFAHVSAVVLHALQGRHYWKRIIFMKYED